MSRMGPEDARAPTPSRNLGGPMPVGPGANLGNNPQAMQMGMGQAQQQQQQQQQQAPMMSMVGPGGPGPQLNGVMQDHRMQQYGGSPPGLAMNWRALLEQLHSEFEAISKEIRACTDQKDEYARSLDTQYSNLAVLEMALFDMERKHVEMKEQYEAEIRRLKRALSEVNGPLPGIPITLQEQFKQQQQQQQQGHADDGLPQPFHHLQGQLGQAGPGVLGNQLQGFGGNPGMNQDLKGGPISGMNMGPGGQGNMPPGPGGAMVGSNFGMVGPYSGGQFQNPSGGLGGLGGPGMNSDMRLMGPGGMQGPPNSGMPMPVMAGMKEEQRFVDNRPAPGPGGMMHPSQQGGFSSQGNPQGMNMHSQQQQAGGMPRFGDQTTGMAGPAPGMDNQGMGAGDFGQSGGPQGAAMSSALGSHLKKRGRESDGGPGSIGNPSDGKAITTTTAGVTTTSNAQTRMDGAIQSTRTFAGEEDSLKQGGDMMKGDGRGGKLALPGDVKGPANDYTVTYENGYNSSSLSTKSQFRFRHSSVICCVRYSWDGSYLASGANCVANLFDARDGTLVGQFRDPESNVMENESDSYVRAVCFTPDGRSLVTGGEDHIVKIWDLNSRGITHRLLGHDSDIFSVDVSSDGRLIASGSGDGSAKLWLAHSGKMLQTFGDPDYGPNDGVTGVVLSPNGQQLAMGSMDMTVRLWDTETGRLLRMLEGHQDSVYSVAFSPDGRSLLSGSLDKSLKLWDLSSPNANQAPVTMSGHRDYVLSVGFSNNGRWVISGSKDKTVQFWDVRSLRSAMVLQGHQNSVICVSHSPRTPQLATGAGDFCARTWNMTYGA